MHAPARLAPKLAGLAGRRMASNLVRAQSAVAASACVPGAPSTFTRAATASRVPSATTGVQQVSRAFHASAATWAAEKDRSWVNKGEVTYDELKPETEAPSGKITIIDVREPDEVAQGIIPSAVSVPLSKFQTAFSGSGTGGNFSQDFGFDRPEFDAPIIVYCRSGKRSQEALEYARSQGWWNVRNYKGSWLDWTAKEEKK